MAAVRRATSWVLLSYRLPREPSTPRIAVWRKLERLGAARLGDGLVGLPADARTREQFEWLAQEIGGAGGVATVWLAAPTDAAQEAAIVDALRQARAAEYESLTAEALAAAGAAAGAAGAAADQDEAARVLRRVRAELGRVARRDFFPPPQREQAHKAMDILAHAAAGGARPVGLP